MKWRDQMSGNTFEFRIVPTKQLEPSPYQRDLSLSLVSSLMNSMSQGVVVPLVVTDDGIVIDGQHRLAAAKRLGILELPCVVVPKSYVDRPFMLNVEKRDDVRDKAIKAYRYYVDHDDAMESSIESVVEGWHYVTLGFAVMLGLRAPGLFAAVVEKVDGCLPVTVRDGKMVRLGRGRLVCDFEKVVEEVTQGQKYEAKVTVVSTVSDAVLGRARRVDVQFEQAIEALMGEAWARKWTWQVS